MTVTAAAYLDHLKSATVRSETAEAELRREFTDRLKAIETDRAFAYRRYNLMRTIADGVAEAESEGMAVANGLAVLRARLGWHSDSEARTAVLSQFAPVAKAMFLSAAPPEAEAPDADVLAALTEFETWYAAKHGTPFWILFENHMPETPVVDF
jgi:hypothetical protein